MTNTIYSLKQNQNKEVHVFKGSLQWSSEKSDNCILNEKSICKKMHISDSKKDIESCLDEDEARLISAKQGRKICGICISHLYGNFD